MARTSTSMGMGIAVTVLSVLAFTGFVLTFVFLGQWNATKAELNNAEASMSEFVRSDERNRDDIRQVADLASRQNQSVVGYLNDSYRTVMTRLTGSPADTPVQANERLMGAGVPETGSVLGALRERGSTISTLQRRLTDAEAARSTAEQDLLSERERVASIRGDFEAQLAAMTGQLDQYSEEVAGYRTGINQTEAAMDQRLERTRNEAANNEARLAATIESLQRDLLTAQDTIGRLQAERSRDLLMPTDEFALVDGEIIGLSPADNAVFISLGRKDKVRLGMQFGVYSEPTAIQPDGEGSYSPGKAFIEIIRIRENDALARIIRELPGNPVVRGDVIANPVYDPNKTYTFLVYGNFDVDGDGRSTPLERADLRAQIVEWGGRVTDELSGEVDFLVLGDRPVLPPQPDGAAPLEIQQEFIRLTRLVRRYDDLLERASAIRLPVLNQNRLETLLYGR